MVGSMNNVLDATTLIICAVYFKYISNYWVHLLIFFFVMQVTSFMISLWLPESPKFLISKGNFI